MKKSFLSLVMLSVFSLSLSAIENQVPVFSDDFETVGLFAEGWKPSCKQVVIEKGKVTMPWGGITLRREVKGNFAITVDLTIGKPTRKSGFCSVIIDGIYFAVRSDGKGWTVYRPPNKKRSLGTIMPIPGFAINKPSKVFVSRHKVGKTYKYVFKVNNKLVSAFVPGMKATNKLSINSHSAIPLKIDNFKLYTLSNAGNSPNMVVNSSFEHLQEGMPPYMNLQTGSSYNYKGANIQDLFDSFVIDRKVKHSGKQSARLTLNKAVRKRAVLSYNTGVIVGKPFVFSVYLKASKSNLPVNLVIWEKHAKWHNKRVLLSTEWKRYEFTLSDFKRNIVLCGVQLLHDGIIWVDDLQVEMGTKASKYQISSLDKDKFTSKKQVVTRHPAVKMKKFSKAPVIDGKLESIWFKKGAKVKDFLFKKKAPGDKTIAWLGCDDDNLYVAVRSFVKDLNKIQAPKVVRDQSKVFGSDCVELFLDPGMTRELYYQFAVNAANSQADVGQGRILGWNGKWQSAVKINKKTKSIDYEIRIPLAIVAAENIGSKWTFNIGRNNKASGEGGSLIDTPQWNFHLPKLYPELIWPAGIVEKYALGADDFKLMQEGKKYSVGGDIVNNSGKAFKAEVQLFDRAGKKLMSKKSILLKTGKNPVQLSYSGIVSKKVANAVLKITQNGSSKYTSRLRMKMSQPLEIYSRYNYYMNEKNAVIVATLNMPNASSLKGVLSVGGKKTTVKLAKDFTINVPLASLSNGIHPVKLEIFKGSKKLLQSQTNIVKKAFRANATQVDHQRRCLIVDGKPFLAIIPATGVQPNTTAEMARNKIEHYRKSGFKCIQFWVKKSALKPAKEFYKAANAAGIKTIPAPVYIWGKKKNTTPEEFVRLFSDPSVIGWLAIDEPELYAKSDEIKQFLTEFRSHTPYQPTFMNNTVIGIPGRFADLNTDIIMLDDYVTNREGRSITDIIKQADIMVEAAKEGRQPIFYFVSGGNLHNHYREPTSGEQTAQTYGSIVSGCSGVSYFLGTASYPAHWATLIRINKELLSLQEVIFSLDKTSPAIISDPGVRFITRKLGKKLYVIAVNIVNNDSDVVITLPAEFKYNSKANVKFENRTLRVKNGKITDKFKGLERHVYCIELK